MRQRIVAFVALIVCAFPASAGHIYEFDGFVIDNASPLFAAGTQISGKLFWTPENAVADSFLPDTYSYVLGYEFNIGSYSVSSGPDRDSFAFANGPVYDFSPDAWTMPGFLDEIYFTPTFALPPILTADLSGIWRLDSTLFLPGGIPGGWHGQVTLTRVPEPGTLALFALGLLMTLLVRRTRLTTRSQFS